MVIWFKNSQKFPPTCKNNCTTLQECGGMETTKERFHSPGDSLLKFAVLSQFMEPIAPV